MPTPENRRRRKTDARAVRVAIWAPLVVFVILIASIWISSYEGRVGLVESQRGGCARGKADRKANAAGWRIAEAARRADGQADVANHYAAIAKGLERRATIVCAEVFPAPRILDFR